MAIIRQIRRALIRRRPFPASWQQLLESSVPYYRFLPDELRDRLRLHMPVLLEEKHFEGCGGLVMTEKIRVVIAAYATILILAEPAGYYPVLKAILVYPDDYVAPVDETDESGIITEGYESRSGESWDLGSIVLSWRDIENDLRNPLGGRNLVFHEFAHQLDDRFGITAGIDEYGRVHTQNEWSEILGDAYRRHRMNVDRGRPTLLDPYGAVHPAEFFSVATETFFERGRRLEEKHEALYRLLREFYGLDPARFLPPA